MNTKLLPQEGLKLIACTTMLVDHIGAAFFPGVWWLRAVGRLAFPIYCFLLSEGMCYTRDPRKYGLRLLVGAVLSELPFDLLFFGRLTLAHQSVMITLLMGFFYGMVQKKVDTLGHRLLLMLPFIILANLMNTDYSGWGVAMVAMFVLTRDVRHRWAWCCLGMALLSWTIGGTRIGIGFLELPVQLFCLLSLIPIGLYSGEKATRSLWAQRAFYLFYPVHLTVLLLIFVLIG